MEKVDQLINSERDKSKARRNFAKPFVKLIGFTFLAAFFCVGVWTGLSMFSPLPSQGRIIFIFVLIIGLLIIFTSLTLLPQTRLSDLLIRSSATLATGYLLFMAFKNYGGI